MNNILPRLTQLIERLQKYPSTSDKKAILKQYPDLKEILELVYNPHIKFYITGKQIENNLNWMTLVKNSNNEEKYKDFIPVLKQISERVFTGDAALLQCMCIIRHNPQYKDTIIKILNKNLKCGISVKTINSIFPNLIPEFQVPLANIYKPEKQNIFKGDYLVSRKLDGIRCLCFITKEGIEFYSRKGKSFWTLGVIEKELQMKFKVPEGGIVLDGELCIIKNGIEVFQKIVSEFRRKDHTINDPLYYVFDIYHLKDFNISLDSFPNYMSKFKLLKDLFNNYSHIKVLEQVPINSDNQLNYPLEWEGLIVRKNGPSSFKRTDNLLKIKSFIDKEFEVLDIVPSTMMIDGVETETCGSLVINYKGNQVDIGSGLSQDQRTDWVQNPKNILGKQITVRYTRESLNKKGEHSLISPRLKGVRDGGE